MGYLNISKYTSRLGHGVDMGDLMSDLSHAKTAITKEINGRYRDYMNSMGVDEEMINQMPSFGDLRNQVTEETNSEMKNGETYSMSDLKGMVESASAEQGLAGQSFSLEDVKKLM